MTSDVLTSPDRSGTVGPRIVVGVDGSAPSMQALAWAAAEAELRGAALEVVHVDFARRVALDALAPNVLSVEQSILDRAVARTKALAPNLPVTGRICDPPAGKALIAASAGADLLVVGSRGVSGLKELALGSVSSECAHHAVCPVVIIRPSVRQPADDPRRSLVGASARNEAPVGH